MTDRYVPGKPSGEQTLFPFPDDSPVVRYTKPETRAALRYEDDARIGTFKINQARYPVYRVGRIADQDMVLVLSPNGEGYAGMVLRSEDRVGKSRKIQYLRELRSLICPQNRVFPGMLDQRLRQLGGFDRNHKQEVVRRAGVLGLTVINGSGS
jgi:hypothetical protein